MTCIVGMEHNGFVFMGGDRAASSPTNIIVSRAPKIVTKLTKPYRRHSEKLILGFAGAFLMGNMIQYKFSPPPIKTGMTPDEYVHTCFVDDLRKQATDNFYNPEEDPVWILVGVKDKLYTIQEDFSILHNNSGYGSIGTGSEYALGALHVLTTHQVVDPQATIKIVLETATLFSPSVCAPFDFLSTES